MKHCESCGSKLPPVDGFCVQCGAPVAAGDPRAGTDPLLRDETLVPMRTDSGAPRADSSSGTRSASWAGEARHWLSALMAVTAGFAAMAALAWLSWLLIGDPKTSSLTLPVASVPLMLALAVGGDVTASQTSLGLQADAAISVRPLGLTLVGHSVLALMFLRRMRTVGPIGPLTLGLHAGRVAVLHTATLTLLALLTRAEISVPSSEVGATPVVLRADLGTTLLNGTLTLAVALAVAFGLARPGLASGRTEYVRGALAAPMRTLRLTTITMVAVTATALVVALAAVSANLPHLSGAPLGFGSTRGTTELWRAGLGLGLLFLPNAAYALLLVGLGIPVSGNAGLGLLGLQSGGSLSIRDLTDADSRYWLWPAATMLVLLVAGAVQARRAPLGPFGRPAVHWLALSLPVALLLLTSGLRGRVDADTGFLAFSGTAGFDYRLALLLGAVFGIVAAALGAALAPRTDPSAPQL